MLAIYMSYIYLSLLFVNFSFYLIHTRFEDNKDLKGDNPIIKRKKNIQRNSTKRAQICLFAMVWALIKNIYSHSEFVKV